VNANGTSSTVYSGRVTNWPLIALMFALTAGLLVNGKVWRGPWPGMLVPAAILALSLAVVVLTTTSLRVTTGPRGVDVRFGPFGLPRFRYARNRIAHAELIDVSIWAVGGWGVHWTPRRGLLLVLRSGPALRLVLTNGRRVTVGVTDPAAALAALDLGA